MALISQAEEQSTVNQWHSKARAGTSSWKYMYMTREVELMEKFYLYQTIKSVVGEKQNKGFQFKKTNYLLTLLNVIFSKSQNEYKCSIL